MQHFKKALLVTGIFILVVSLLSVPFICIFMHSDSFTDRKVRQELAGELDYLIVGASHGLRALKPSILNEYLGCSSYNLCGVLMTFNGREALLNEELARNDINTVIIELSYDALSRTTNAIEGDMHTIPRLGSFPQKTDYLLKNVEISQWDYLYHHYFSGGARAFVQEIKQIDGIYSTDNGYRPCPTNNVTFTPAEISEKYNTYSIDIAVNPNSTATLERMVNTIRAENAEILFVVTPLSDSFIWEAENWSAFESTMADLSQRFDVEVFDFNLLKSRYRLFTDETSFFDSYHMSDEGATVFSEEYCKVMNMVNSGESVDDLFYGSYAEMKADSPYNNP